MTGELDRLGFYLTSRGHRYTPERRQTLQAILDQAEHFTAEDIIETLRRNRSKVSRASVYRTLDLLLTCGALHRVDLGESRAYYERLQTHHHLVCAMCGRVVEFTHPLLDRLKSELLVTHAFQVSDGAQTLTGTCQDCRAKTSQQGDETLWNKELSQDKKS